MRWLSVLVTATLLLNPAAADDELGLDLALEDAPVLTEAKVDERLGQALALVGPQEQATALAALLADVAAAKDIVLPAPLQLRLGRALTAHLEPKRFAEHATVLVDSHTRDPFDPALPGRLNLGLQLALHSNAVPAATLTKVYHKKLARVNLEWLLPALGRAAGAAALPLLKSHRNDGAIIPLNNGQNIRREPCAAVYGAAYAGDKVAIDLLLDWYETDSKDLPRFAFYVSWARQNGQKPDIALMEFCEHRILQAELFLRSRPSVFQETLEAMATRPRVSLTSFALSEMKRLAGDDLSPYLSMLRHPSLLAREQVLAAIMTRGSNGIKAQATDRVSAQRKAPRALDRVFAIESLARLTPSEADAIYEKGILAESNVAAKRRLQLGSRTIRHIK